MRWGEGASDRGSGSILGVAILAGVLCLAALLLPLAGVVSSRARVAAAADAAALAAADVASGILPGVPCEAAERVAAANGATVSDCEVNDLVVTVRAATTTLGFVVRATATAGPPVFGG